MKGPCASKIPLEILVNHKYYRQICEIFTPMFEDWMDSKDKHDLILMSLQVSGKTLESIGDDFETGIINGYSIESQIEACNKALSG